MRDFDHSKRATVNGSVVSGEYRLRELVGVYGDALRDRCQELIGDGILSAIAAW